MESDLALLRRNNKGSRIPLDSSGRCFSGSLSVRAPGACRPLWTLSMGFARSLRPGLARTYLCIATLAPPWLGLPAYGMLGNTHRRAGRWLNGACESLEKVF